jgi:hypothetical protein
MGPKGSQAIHNRDKARQNPLKVIIGQPRRIQTEMSLHDFPERLDCLVTGKLKPFVLNIHLAESLQRCAGGRDRRGGIRFYG